MDKEIFIAKTKFYKPSESGAPTINSEVLQEHFDVLSAKLIKHAAKFVKHFREAADKLEAAVIKAKASITPADLE